MIVVVSGWRKWADAVFIRSHLHEAWPFERVRVGDNPAGVDALVRALIPADLREDYAANWRHLGHAAGPERNGRMMVGTDGRIADRLLAFPQPNRGPYRGSGTWDAIRQAVEYGITVTIPGYPKLGGGKGDTGNDLRRVLG